MSDYLERLGQYAGVDYRLVQDESVTRRDEGAVRLAVQREGERLLKGISGDAFVSALDREGDLWLSEDLAGFLARREVAGTTRLSFVIGTAGLAPAVLARAQHRLSLSRMTLTHQLVPIVLAEQLYRA